MFKMRKRLESLNRYVCLLMVAFFLFLFSVPAWSVNLADYGAVGNGVADDTKALQDAINASAGKTLVIPKPAVKYKTNPLWLVSNLKIQFAAGTVIEANTGYQGIRQLPGYPGPVSDCVFHIDNIENVYIEGNGSTIQMLKPEYTTGEHRHCIDIASSKNVTILDMTLRDSGGDGISISASGLKALWDVPSENIHLRGIKCINNRRQGISIVSAVGLLIENCEFRDTNGTSPEAGIDIEPGYDKALSRGIVIKNCLFSGNRQHGIVINLRRFNDVHGDKINAPQDPSDIKVQNCRFIGPADQFEMWGVDKDSNGPNTGQARGQVTVSDCSASGTNGSGFVKFGSQVPLLLERCTADHFGLYVESNEAHIRSRAGFGIYGSNTTLTDCKTTESSWSTVTAPDQRWDIGISGEYWEPYPPINNIIIRNFQSDASLKLSSNPKIMVWDMSNKSETNIGEVESLAISYDIPPQLVLPVGTHNISYGEAGKVIVVGKEVGETTVNLPKVVAVGAKLTFQVAGMGTLKIVPFPNDRISKGTGTFSTVKSSGLGKIVLECAGQGLWRVADETGKWTYIP